MEFGFIVWNFLLAIYESGWNKLVANKEQKSFRQGVSMQFNRKSLNNSVLKEESKGKGKQASIFRIFPLIFLWFSKSVLAKFKFFKGNQESKLNSQSNNPLYVQISKRNIQNFLKIKDVSSKLSVKTISEIHNVINKSNQKDKPKLNMTTKNPSRKQAIISMGTNNTEKVIVQLNIHVANINRLLKNIKLEVSIDFIWSDNKGIIVTTNKIAVMSDLNVVEEYMKNLNDIDSSNIISSRFL